LGGSHPETISVVVPCFGHAAYLPLAIESLRRQTCGPQVVVFVDDDSPDETREVLRSSSSDWVDNAKCEVRVLTNPTNLGQTASLNRAISEVDTDLVMILNDDDYLMHDAVEVVLHLFAMNPELGLIGATCVPFSGDDALAQFSKSIIEVSTDREPRLTFYPSSGVHAYRQGNDLNMTHSGSTFRRSAWAQVGGYYPNKKERVVRFSDRDFQIRVNALFPVAVSESVPFSFWRTDSSVDGSLNS
jgi:GT2 family glycosyltransferase